MVEAPAAGSVAGAEGSPEEANVVLRLHVQPGAGRSAVLGRHGDALRVRVAPPPVDGRANTAVLALVAELLEVPERQVSLAGGERSRDKRVRVTGVDPAAVAKAIDRAIEEAGTAPGGRDLHGHRRH